MTRKGQHLIVGVLLVLLSIPVLSPAQNAEGKISGFRFYLTDDDGRHKGVVNGYKADFLSPDEIQITDASAELTDISSYPVFLQTPMCVFVKSSYEMRSDAAVAIRTKGVEISGTGLIWSFEQKVITINKDVVVDVSKNVQKSIQAN